MLLTVIAAGLFAALFSLAIGLKADRLGERLGLLDWPDPCGGRKRHERVTPLMGGTAVVVSVLAGALMAWAVAGRDSPVIADHLLWFCAASGALYIIGLADDRFGLGPRVRLLLALLVFLLASLHAPDFRLLFLRFSGVDELMVLQGFGLTFTLVCLVGLLNAVNMADGKNGLVLSISLFWALMLMPLAPAHLAPVLVALAMALAVMLGFNLAGRLFLGDGGSYGLSAILGLLAIYIYNHRFGSVDADRIALLFAVPVFDTIRLISMRAARGRSPFAGDRDHLHHHVAYRWGWPRGLLVYFALVAAPSLLALVFPEAAGALLFATAVAYGAVLLISSGGGSLARVLRERHRGRLQPNGGRATSGPPAGA